jgi:hypothetical protein
VGFYFQNRQQLIHIIDELPSKALPELGSFLDYLRFKVRYGGDLADKLKDEVQSINSGSFLLAIAGLGASDEADLSERAEEILASSCCEMASFSPRRQALTRCSRQNGGVLGACQAP